LKETPAFIRGTLLKRIIARSTLADFWTQHADAQDALDAWFEIAKASDWRTPQEVKTTFASASIIGDNRVVFNIKGNDYRLIVHFEYAFSTAYIKWIGTHNEYDKIDAEKVGR
jgi:mRNA interferase HigB